MLHGDGGCARERADPRGNEVSLETGERIVLARIVAIRALSAARLSKLRAVRSAARARRRFQKATRSA